MQNSLFYLSAFIANPEYTRLRILQVFLHTVHLHTDTVNIVNFEA